MEIRQFRYFLEIVHNDCNLSQAAKKLYISQPALSQLIRYIEENENILLFERQGGRLQKLTTAGEIFYEYAAGIVAQYDRMLTSIRDGNRQLRGKVRIGIPPLVQSAIFADVLANLIIDHPNIDVEIVEKGSFELQNIFLANELDIAFLLDPTYINPTMIEENPVTENELTAFLHADHPLATKEKLDWTDLNGAMMATLDSTFMVQRKTQQKLVEYNIQPQKTFTSVSWDFLMLMVSNSSFITILPAPIASFYNNKQIVQKYFNDPVLWRVMLSRPVRKHYSFMVNYVYDYLKDYFESNPSASQEK